MFKKENMFDVKLGNNRRKCSCCGSKEEMMIKRMNHEFAGIKYGYNRKIFDNELEIEKLNYYQDNYNENHEIEIKYLYIEIESLKNALMIAEQRHKQRIKQIGGNENE